VYWVWCVGEEDARASRGLLPGSLQSFRLRLKDLVRDKLIGCLDEGPRREANPEGWEVEVVGPEPGSWRTLPVFKWSFSAFRFSTVDCETGTGNS
jgi:hypothetical protein